MSDPQHRDLLSSLWALISCPSSLFTTVDPPRFAVVVVSTVVCDLTHMCELPALSYLCELHATIWISATHKVDCMPLWAEPRCSSSRNTEQPPIGAHVNVRWEECRPSEALWFDVTTTLTRTEWIEVVFARTDVVSRAACALELKFAANNALELVQSMLRQVLFLERLLPVHWQSMHGCARWLLRVR